MNNRIDIASGRWWDRMWNVTAGCTEVSEGCEHCYARTLHNLPEHLRFRQLPWRAD